MAARKEAAEGAVCRVGREGGLHSWQGWHGKARWWVVQAGVEAGPGGADSCQVTPYKWGEMQA